MPSSTSQLGLAKYAIPSLTSSPLASFHPSHTGSSARTSLLFEAVVGSVEGLLLIYYAEPCVRWLASSSVEVTPLAVSMWRIIGAAILGTHLPLGLAIPNRRTNIEGRPILQAYFSIFEVVCGFTFAGLALLGEEKTGLRSERMWLLTAGVASYMSLRTWTAFGKEAWAGAYVEEGSKKDQ
jgi:hypothetical protein